MLLLKVRNFFFNVLEDLSNSIDCIGIDSASNEYDEHDKDFFKVGDGGDVSIAYGAHGDEYKVDRVEVLGAPSTVFDFLFDKPGVGLAEDLFFVFGDGVKKASKKVCYDNNLRG